MARSFPLLFPSNCEKGKANSRISKKSEKGEKNLKQSQLAGERSEAWQEVFLYWSPQTVKKITKKREKKLKTKSDKKVEN